MEAKALARVNGQSITELDVDQAIQSMGQRAQQFDTPQGRAYVLEQLINQKLLLADAQANMYELNRDFKDQLNKFKDELLVDYTAQKIIEKVTVSDEEVKAYFEENKDQFKGQLTLNASHILVNEEAEANEILAELKAGNIKFEEAAVKYSSCPSKNQGGNLGDFTVGQMVPEFEKACIEMNVGEISEAPVQTQFGWHIIRLNSKVDGDDIKFEDIADQLKGRVLSEKQQKAFQSKLNQLKLVHPVEKFDI